MSAISPIGAVMANRIHKHISKAVSKRKQHQQIGETVPVSPPQAQEHEQEQELMQQAFVTQDDPLLEQRLDNIIETQEEAQQTIEVEKDTLTQEYKTLFNTQIDSQNLTMSVEALSEHHHAIIEQLVNKYCPKVVLPDIQDKIHFILNEVRAQELALHNAYHNIEKQRQLLVDFQLSVKDLPYSDEKDKIIKFIDLKLQLSSYKPILQDFKSVVSKGKYFTDPDNAALNLFTYLRQFILLNNYEFGLISHLMIQTSIKNPYESDTMLNSLKEIDEFVSNYPSVGLDKITRFIHHAITYINELVSIGKTNEFLSQVNLEQVKRRSLQTLLDNALLWNKLEQSALLKKSGIDKNKLAIVSENLSHYQGALNEFGKLKIHLLIVKNDFTAIDHLKGLHQKIIDLGSSFKILKKLKNDIAELKDESFNEIKDALTSLSRQLKAIKTAIMQSGVDEYGIQSILLFRIARGDFFSTKDRDNLISAIFDIHSVINPIKLINNLIDNFKQYTQEKQEECLIFLKNYLLLDTDNSLINVKYDKSEFIDKIDLFLEYVNNNTEDNPHIQEMTNEISDILVQKIVDKTNAFSTQMDLISKGDIPQIQLLRMLNTIAEEIPVNLHNNAKMEELVLEVNFILEAPNLLLESDAVSNEKIINAIASLCSILRENTEFGKLCESIAQKTSALSPKPLDPSKSLIWDGVLQNSQHFDFNKMLFEIISDHKMMFENEKLILSFVDGIESGFIYHFSNINLSQLRNLTWSKDDERMNNGLMPVALNIRYYYQYFNVVVHYMMLVLLSQLEREGVEIVARESLIEVKKIHEFIEKATMRAIDKGAIATAKALNTVLNAPVIKRLALGKAENEILRNKSIENSISSTQVSRHQIFEQAGIPYLGQLLELIARAYNRKAGSEFEKRVVVGKVLQLVEEKKHSIKESTVRYDFIEQMVSFMNNAELILPPVFKNDLLLDIDKIIKLSNNASEYIKPDTYKTYEVNDFHTLPGIKNQLSYWLNRMEDFHLNTKQPQIKLIELVLSILETDEVLEHFSESLDILAIINEIEENNNRTYKNYEHDLHSILSIYYKKIAALLKAEFIEPSDSLSTFFSIFHKNKKIKQYSEQESTGHNPFSAQHNLREMIQAIIKLEKKYIRALELSNETQGQQAYSQLLLKVLEGGTQNPLIQLGNPQETSFATAKSLLPESEYPVPQAEPEHPDYIGLNRTMDFNPDTKYRSTLELFASTELKKDFMQSFIWAIDNNAIQKLETARFSPGINLVAIDHAVEPHLQLTLINYILLSLDCIGKLAGPRGELSLQNFNRIKKITDSLQEVALMLTYAEIDHEILTTKLDHMIYKLILTNNDLHDMLSQTSAPVLVLQNEELNDFCHINEYLSHKLLGIPYQKSVLSPMDPFSKVLDKLNPKIKEDLLRHSGIDIAAIVKLSRQSKADISPDPNQE